MAKKIRSDTEPTKITLPRKDLSIATADERMASKRRVKSNPKTPQRLAKKVSEALRRSL